MQAWGVRQVTLVDQGRVAYSNPVRQSLFTFDDCRDGGRAKAQCAAEALRRIFPGVEARGVDLRVVMPGHGAAGAARDDVDHLERLVRQHDAVFLLTDTRESRWLPTMLAAFHGKVRFFVVSSSFFLPFFFLWKELFLSSGVLQNEVSRWQSGPRETVPIATLAKQSQQVSMKLERLYWDALTVGRWP